MDLNLSLIVASTNLGGIGYNNMIPWYIQDDLINFKYITSNTIDKNKKNVVIMGKNTWDSLSRKPLPNRINLILTTNK